MLKKTPAYAGHMVKGHLNPGTAVAAPRRLPAYAQVQAL